MTLLRSSVVVGAVTFLEAGCLLGLACLGRAAVPLAMFPKEADVESVHEVSPATVAITEPESLSSLAVPAERAPLAASAGATPAGDDDRGSAKPPRTPRSESEFLRALLAGANGDGSALEVAVRSALAGDGPDCEKVAALRAVVEAGSTAANELLAASVQRSRGLSNPNQDAVPRFALRLLAERSANDAEARAHLMRFAFSSDPSLDRRLRASSAAAYALVADESEIGGLEAILGRETDPLVRESALEALGRNPHSAAAHDVLSRLGVERSVPDEQE